jgi:hypothetical protein
MSKITSLREKMRMIQIRYVLPLVLAALLAGCAPLVFFGAGAAAGLAGYKFYEGSLTVTYRAPYIKTWDATLAALKEMKLPIEKADHDQISGKIVARRADGKAVTVSLEYKSSTDTKVSIRVGELGDQRASEVIERKIRDILFKD